MAVDGSVDGQRSSGGECKKDLPEESTFQHLCFTYAFYGRDQSKMSYRVTVRFKCVMVQYSQKQLAMQL